jgi:hypothetical protein
MKARPIFWLIANIALFILFLEGIWLDMYPVWVLQIGCTILCIVILLDDIQTYYKRRLAALKLPRSPCH